MSNDYFLHETALADEYCEIGKGSSIWHFSHVMTGAVLGTDCNLGQNVVISPGVLIGNNVKIQNNVSVYTGTEIEDDVFLGPSCVLTNVTNPRSQINRKALYEKTLIKRGASIGANATIVCGVTLGRYCFIGAGAVVTKDIPDYALIIGNPGRQHGFVSRHGHRLSNPDEGGVHICPETRHRYQLNADGEMRCLDLNEEDPLPPDLRVGTKNYDDLKNK